MSKEFIKVDFDAFMKEHHKVPHGTTYIMHGIDGKLPDGMRFDEKGRAVYHAQADKADNEK